MDAKRFGAFISERRKEHHMTQADLAGKVGVTDKAVSRWERGLGFPDINTMEPLAEALDVSLLELMRSEMQTTEGANVKKDEAAENQHLRPAPAAGVQQVRVAEGIDIVDNRRQRPENHHRNPV